MSAYRDLIRAAESLIHTTTNNKVMPDELARLADAVQKASRERAKARSVEARQDSDAEWRLRRQLDASEIAHARTMGDRDNLRRENRHLYEIMGEAFRHLSFVSLPLWNAEHVRQARLCLLAAVPTAGKKEAVAMRGREEEAA